MFQRKKLSHRRLRAVGHGGDIFGSEKVMALLAVAALLERRAV